MLDKVIVSPCIPELLGTSNPDVILKKKVRRQFYADAVSEFGDTPPNVDDYRRSTVDDCRQPILDVIYRPDSAEFR